MNAGVVGSEGGLFGEQKTERRKRRGEMKDDGATIRAEGERGWRGEGI
jgi:hypothetical protein